MRLSEAKQPIKLTNKPTNQLNDVFMCNKPNEAIPAILTLFFFNADALYIWWSVCVRFDFIAIAIKFCWTIWEKMKSTSILSGMSERVFVREESVIANPNTTHKMKLSTILMVDFITFPIFTELQYIIRRSEHVKLVWKLSNLF